MIYSCVFRSIILCFSICDVLSGSYRFVLNLFLNVHKTWNKSILFRMKDVLIIFQYFWIHVEQNQMKIVWTISTKMVMCAEVIYILSKGFSECLYLKNTCTYNGTLITTIIWIQIYNVFFFHFEDCPAGYFGKNCNDKCKHPFMNL